MLILASNPFQMKVKSALFIVHPKDEKNPDSMRALETISCETKQIVKAGESILTEARFFSFDTYVLLPTSNQKEFLSRLYKDNWQERLMELRKTPKRYIVALGNVVPLLGPRITIVPKDTRENVVMNQIYQSGNIDVDTQGLNLTTHRFDVNFVPNNTPEKYLRVIRTLSNHEMLFLLDPQVVVFSDGSVKFGAFYSVIKGKIGKCAALPEQLTDKAQDKIQQRGVIPPAKVLYEEDLTKEQKDEIKATESDKKVKLLK